MEHLQGVLDHITHSLPNGVGDQLRNHINRYTQDSNGVLLLIVGLIVVYFLLKMVMPMVQSVIVVAVMVLVAWVALQKWNDIKK